MDFQSAMETFAEAWVAANSKGAAPLSDVSVQSQALALTRSCKTPPPTSTTTTSATGRSSKESAERLPSPPTVRSSTPLENTVSSPSIKEEFDPAKQSPVKTIPVHCIVESVCPLDESRSLQHGIWRRRPTVETDSYVIIPLSTAFRNLVVTVLLRLGYSPEMAGAARGSVVIKNWKALNLEQISDDPVVTVGDILAELTTVATLRIQVFRQRTGTLTDIKDKLLKFLLVQSHHVLLNSGCPLDENFLSWICRGPHTTSGPYTEIPEEIRRKFEQWWNAQFSTQTSPARTQLTNSFQNQYSVPTQIPKLERTIAETGHPALQTVHNQFPTQKTRMRTSFDPELELPKLQRWFNDNQHPSRQQIQQYVKELNSLESRRGRKPLDVNNVVYWFKNARAAQKRAEIRNVVPGLPCHLAVNGYSNHSPTNGSGYLISDGYLNSERLTEHRMKNNLTPRRNMQASHTSDEFSNPGSELDEDDMNETQPPSPSRPLSLTTSRKESRETSPCVSTPAPPPDIQVQNCKEEAKDEPINYHSPPDHVNNNNNNNKMSISDMEEDNDVDDKSAIEDGNVTPNRNTPHRFCNSPEVDMQLVPRPPNDGLERLAAGFPLIPNSMFSQSIMYMSHYIPGFPHTATSPPGSSALGMTSLSADERRKRNRTFIDPVTEVPRLEQWFTLNTHPSQNLIVKYTEELNCMPYRQKFPRLEPKNVQFWFKNRRAKSKRLKMSLFDNHPPGQYHHGERD